MSKKSKSSYRRKDSGDYPKGTMYKDAKAKKAAEARSSAMTHEDSSQLYNKEPPKKTSVTFRLHDGEYVEIERTEGDENTFVTIKSESGNVGLILQLTKNDADNLGHGILTAAGFRK